VVGSAPPLEAAKEADFELHDAAKLAEAFEVLVAAECGGHAGEVGGGGIYDLRHTFASHALAAGVPIFELARFMGTSVRMIDRTYGHLVRGSEHAVRDKLGRYAEKTFGPLLGHETRAGNRPVSDKSAACGQTEGRERRDSNPRPPA